MEIVTTAPTVSPQKEQSSSWLDLILYLVVGMGGFFAASMLVGRIINTDVMTLPLSILAYTLNITFFAGSVLVLGVARGKLSLREIGFVPPRVNWKWFIAAIGISLALLPLRGVIGVIVQYLAGGNLDGLQERMDVIAPDGFTWAGFLVTLIGVGILVPISEELFFRGAIFTWFRGRYSFPIAMLASSLLFALGHFDSIGVVASSLCSCARQCLCL